MPSRVKKIGLLSLPYLGIVIISFIIMFAQIKSHAFIAGVDAFFHMNRFYDTAMQIKTGHYSYFASVFGFNQTGRIVNALYGPAFSYLNGFVLLISGTWFRFQIVDSLLVLIIGGCLMYRLCRMNKVKIAFALPIAMIYMLSMPMLIWILDQQFTGWGAALMPLVIMAGSYMVNHLDVKVVPLALAMTVMFQTHLMSTLIGAVALIPIFIFSWLKSSQKAQMLIHLGLSIILTLFLTGNVWGAMLEVFHGNNLIPVFPQTNMMINSIGVNPNRRIDELGISFNVTLILVLILLLIFWRQLNYRIKIFAGSGLFILWISSRFFPWNWTATHFPVVTYTLQMPKRFVVVAIVLLLLSLGMIFSQPQFQMKNVKFDTSLKVILLLMLFTTNWDNFQERLSKRINNYNSQQIVSQPIWLLHYNSDDADQMRNAFHSTNLSTGVNIITKATPDYLPAQEPITDANYMALHPYHLTNTQLIDPDRVVKKWVNDNGNLTIEWKNGSRHRALNSIPVVKYAHTEIILNGRQVKPKYVTKIGKVQVMARPGVNKMEIKYVSSTWFKLLMWITVIAWIALLISLFI